LTAAEGLIVHWWSLANGRGLSIVEAGAVLAALGAMNVVAFPLARTRIRAEGVALVLSRGWIIGSVAALLAGLLLGCVFAIVGVGWLLGSAFAAQSAPPVQPILVIAGGVAVAVGFGSIGWAYLIGQRWVVVENVQMPLGNVAPAVAKLRIAHITDLHIGPLMRAQQLGRLIEKVNDLDPDLVVITGDIFDFDPSFIEEGCRELDALDARFGVFAVLGNHDVYTGADAVAAGIERFTSIRLLRDTWAEIDVGGDRLCLVGLEDTGTGWTERDAEDPTLDRLAREAPGGDARLLLVHRPSFFRQAARLGFPALLSGHTHGGQICLPFGRSLNASRLIAHFTRGLFEDGGTTLYVNRGLGVAGLPLRLNCSREIALIRLVSNAAGR
jgi:predicted MPP superfamily phosphohydrolase